MNLIYVDELSYSILPKLLFGRGLKKVRVLESISKKKLLLVKLLRFSGVDIKEADFYAGHLRTHDNESVMLNAQTLASQLSFKAAEKIIQGNRHLKFFNKYYGRNSIKLFVAKNLYYYIARIMTMASVVNYLDGSNNPSLWLKRSCRFDMTIISKQFPGIKIQYYTRFSSCLLELIKLLVLDVARSIKFRLKGFFDKKNKRVFDNRESPGILMIQEDDIHNNIFLRRQPHWHDEYTAENNIYILEKAVSENLRVNDKKSIEKQGVFTFATSLLYRSLKYSKKNKVLKEVNRHRMLAVIYALFSGSMNYAYYLIMVRSWLWRARLMGAVSCFLNVKLFLVRETHSRYSDAMMLIAPHLHIRTVMYQYSNIGVMAPVMIATPDELLLFSSNFEKIFSCDDIKPVKTKNIGYLYDDAPIFLRDRAETQRKELMKNGARFIICFFDENIQHDKWGLVSPEDNLSEIHALIDLLLKDPAIGLVTKSQFMFNSISQLYPGDEKIKKALGTGRFLELKEGKVRNNIYPSEAALISDICISHKFGATAALESVISKRRTVLLDPYGFKTSFDELYDNPDIQFNNIFDFLEALQEFRKGNEQYRNLGDWSDVIDDFVSVRDGKAKQRLISTVCESFNC